MSFKVFLCFFAFLIAVALSAPAPEEPKDLEASEKGDLQTAASHWGGYGYGHGWGGYGGFYGGYYPHYGYGWGYPGYGYGSWYGHGWPYYGHGYWW